MTNHAAEPTAAQTYAARRADIARLLDVLDMELQKHDEGFRANPRDWGFGPRTSRVPFAQPDWR